MDKKKQDPIPLSSRLQEIFTRKDWKTLWQIYMLAQQWPAVVGKDVAKKSEPAYIQNDTLWVYIESSVLMQHMQTQKLSLIDKIQDNLPDAEIKDIRWAMRPASAPGRKQQSSIKKRGAPDPQEKKAFNAMASTIEDEQCREALKKLWDSYFDSEQ